METFDAISKRSSVREYQDLSIDKNILQKLVDAGRRAPSARAVEPWEFVVITQKEILSKLGQIADHGEFLNEAAASIVVYCDETKYYLEDGCAATENILIAAADAGIGACWIAGDKKPYAENVSEILGAPANLKLISIISLGWPKEEILQEKNRSLEDVIHWNKF